GRKDAKGNYVYACLIIGHNDFKFYLGNLDFNPDLHNAENIFNELEKKLKEHDIVLERIIGIVTDNLPLMVTLKNIITEKYPHIYSLRCVSHDFNTITEWCLNFDEEKIKDVKIHCKQLLSYFSDSQYYAEVLSDWPKKNKVKLGLEMYSDSSWDSFLKLFQCVEAHKERFSPLNRMSVKTLEMLAQTKWFLLEEEKIEKKALFKIEIKTKIQNPNLDNTVKDDPTNPLENLLDEYNKIEIFSKLEEEKNEEIVDSQAIMLNENLEDIFDFSLLPEGEDDVDIMASVVAKYF
ncbi:hypothetical protein HK099_001230, partial [Clydaea vesicula]